MRNEKRANELAGGSRRRSGGNEVEEAVQSESEKDQTEQETGNDNSGFHVKICLIELKYIDINIICVKSISQ
jgi:hypothetical protein